MPDDAGYVYVASCTGSIDLPAIEGAHDEDHNGGWDGFVAKLTPDGGDLVYLTYLGGSGQDYLIDLVVDTAGRAQVVGFTTSSDFPTEAAFQTQCLGSEEVTVTKLSPDGAGLVYSSYLGGSGLDRVHGVALDGDDSAYVVGLTGSTSVSFPVTPGAFQPESAGGYDAFLAKIDTTGALEYCTYLGGYWTIMPVRSRWTKPTTSISLGIPPLSTFRSRTVRL